MQQENKTISISVLDAPNGHREKQQLLQHG